MSVVFGSVSAQRLGSCLFVERAAAKRCSYSCTYCPRGATTHHQVARTAIGEPHQIVDAVIREVEAQGQAIDRIVLSCHGEPTLDADLGRTIAALQPLDIPVGLASNGSLLTRDDVRAELGQADWVSLKLDTVCETTWRTLNAPHPGLHFDLMLQGLRVFAAEYRGELATETVLIDGQNTSFSDLEHTADFISTLEPAVAYLSLPSDRSTGSRSRPPDDRSVARAEAFFSERMRRVELLTGWDRASGDGVAAPACEQVPSPTPCWSARQQAHNLFALRPLAAGQPAEPMAPRPPLAKGTAAVTPPDGKPTEATARAAGHENR